MTRHVLTSGIQFGIFWKRNGTRAVVPRMKPILRGIEDFAIAKSGAAEDGLRRGMEEGGWLR